MAISLTERDRRWRLLQSEMAAEGLDALVLAGNDYRGHKGSLRYVADYDLIHRYGFAVMFGDGAPVMVLPQNLQSSRRPASRWVDDYRYPYAMGAGLAEVVCERGRPERLGIVGLGQVMRIADHQALAAALLQTEIVDASGMFERVRAVKSAEEIRGAEESAFILDACLDRLLEIARPGMTERAIAAEMHGLAHALGGADPLFLTMYTDVEPVAGARATSGAPRDRVLEAHDVFTFSFEVVGPAGYWTELARMVTFARPSAAVEQMARAVTAGLDAGRAALVPGAGSADVQQAVIAAIEAEGAESTYWSGHGIGLDVLEEPWIGLDVVQDARHAQTVTTVETGMVIALHPKLWDAESATTGYMAETFVVEPDGGRTLSRHPLRLHRVPDVA